MKKIKLITYLYYNYKREEFVFVNYGNPYSIITSDNLFSASLSKNHWMLDDAILLDDFIEEIYENNI